MEMKGRTANAFDEIEAKVAEEIMLVYTDANKPLHVCTDARDVLAGSALVQHYNVLEVYSTKIARAQ